MKDFFECSLRYEKYMDSGVIKKVTDKYLVDALSFTEAESRIISEVGKCVRGELVVKSIRRTRITEIFFNKTDKTDLRWFVAKIKFIMLDERTQKERITRSQVMVEAESIDDAHENIIKSMQGTLCDYNVESITESAIVDVILYKSE